MEQRSDEWFEARLGRVTASRIGDLMAKTKTGGYAAGRGNYMAELLLERLTGQRADGFTSAPMQWGIDHEDSARSCYEFETGNTVQEAGFIQHPTLYAGASPDGFVGDDGLIEIKCPNTKQHIDFLLNEKIDRSYILQMQWQMACTGRDWCDFVSYDPRLPVEMQLSIQRVNRDDEMISTIKTEVRKFLQELHEMEEALRNKYSMAEVA